MLLESDYIQPPKPLPPIPVRVSRRSQLTAALRHRQRSPPIGHSVRPDHYRNARLVPVRGGSLTLSSFFELNLSKK
jgi:hypothetical protein